MEEIEVYKISADALQTAVSRLIDSDRQVVAPVRAPKGDIFFQPVDSVGDIAFDYGNTQISPVEFLKPSKEIYFEYERGEEGKPKISPPPAPKPRILLGIRPCDVAAIEFLDHFFLKREPIDALYRARRESVTLIAMACEHPAADTCFCTCCEGGGPVAESGFDVQLSKVEDEYLVEVATEKGEKIRDMWEDLLEPARKELVQARDDHAEKIREEEFEPTSNLAAAIRRVSADKVSKDTWQEIAKDCYSCGGCSFVCPVCTCFDVNDQQHDEEHGARVRQADSCRLWGYPREAAGGVRGFTTAYRARMYAHHKLGYSHFRERGRYGCVGCGRCIMACLGHMGMPTVCTHVRRSQPHAENDEQKTNTG
ncbi:MAG: 4Fe-4S dicluster domain-containing protein [Armatimonadota bacterium]